MIDGGAFATQLAADADLRRDLPRYRLWRRGELVAEPTDVVTLWQPDFVAFLIGCSFTFETALRQAGLPLRHIEQGRNVPMYRTTLACVPAGPFRGNMVVSMRPMTPADAERAAAITAEFPRMHGAPIQIGDPQSIGIANLERPDFGDAVTLFPGEVPVFWACGVTPQVALSQAAPEIAITHSPGCMFLTDMADAELATGTDGRVPDLAGE